MGGAGYIPWSKAMLFAERAGVVSEDDCSRFCRMMRAMDDEYLGWLAEKQKKPDGKS